MNYKEAEDFIKSTMKFGSKLGLDNMKMLIELLDNPHNKLKVIHVAGTNGKGSTCAFINGILKEAGYKVGLYTSPSIEGFTGRIKINNENISEYKFADLANKVKNKIEIMVAKGMSHPTEFEIVTAMALLYFYEQAVDFVVLEVGLGGRLDATNIVDNPLLSIITPIGYDHTEYLGDTLGKIAFEKAGIIKENNLVLSSRQEKEAMEVIEEVSKNKKSEIVKIDLSTLDIHESELYGQKFSIEIVGENYKNVNIKLIGLHQIENACLALTAIELLRKYKKIKIDKDKVYDGLMKTTWPGRFEIISNSPITIIDGAHNVHAAVRLKETINRVIPNKSITLVIGMLGDKDINGVLENIIPLCKEIVVTEPNNSRALTVDELVQKIEKLNSNTHKSLNIEDAIKKAYAISKTDQVVLIAGSLYLIEKVRNILKTISDN